MLAVNPVFEALVMVTAKVSLIAAGNAGSVCRVFATTTGMTVNRRALFRESLDSPFF